jgi:hypothetical protein
VPDLDKLSPVDRHQWWDEVCKLEEDLENAKQVDGGHVKRAVRLLRDVARLFDEERPTTRGPYR